MATAADADDEAEAEDEKDGGESGGGFVFCAFHSIGDNRHSPRPAECTLGRE